ncbi:MAG: uncharacterized protein H6R26_3429, partial [Proteobacteria bacterium]|nr:uncharacterized protein [Pseudomonadota bacterium]
MIRSLSIAFLTVALSACNTSAPARFFTLMPASATSAIGQQGIGDKVIAVGPVTIPASLNQAQIVVSKGDHEVDVRENERWASPLKDEITAALAARLASLVGGATVAADSQTAADHADVRILVDFARIELKPGDKVTLDAVWTVKSGGKDVSRHGRTVVSV